ncbi:MAG: DUF3419 family protein [Firmicutes bacterium]|nr:DUF3419 family protein [Bacillota bacterium]
MSSDKKFSFIRYANCWEDSEILLEALDIKKGEVGLSIASAGDNTLAMLLCEPQKVYAFDLNKTQLFCMELKMAAFRKLEYDTTLELLGVRKSSDRLKLYEALKGDMSEEARAYFDENPSIIRRGIIHTGKFEHYFHLFRKYVAPLFCSKKKLAEFCGLQSLNEQKAFYNKHINNRRLNFIFSLYFGSSVMGALGRDKSFYDYVDDKENSGLRIKKRFEYGVCNTVNRTNPYLNYILRNNFTAEALPLYLRRENYSIIRNNLDRVELLHCDLMSLPDIKFDFFNLSDIFEYMSDESFAENIAKLGEISNIGARAAYWNMQTTRRISDEKWTLDEELSKALFRQDRAYFYRDFLVYRRGG